MPAQGSMCGTSVYRDLHRTSRPWLGLGDRVFARHWCCLDLTHGAVRLARLRFPHVDRPVRVARRGCR